MLNGARAFFTLNLVIVTGIYAVSSDLQAQNAQNRVGQFDDPSAWVPYRKSEGAPAQPTAPAPIVQQPVKPLPVQPAQTQGGDWAGWGGAGAKPGEAPAKTAAPEKTVVPDAKPAVSEAKTTVKQIEGNARSPRLLAANSAYLYYARIGEKTGREEFLRYDEGTGQITVLPYKMGIAAASGESIYWIGASGIQKLGPGAQRPSAVDVRAKPSTWFNADSENVYWCETDRPASGDRQGICTMKSAPRTGGDSSTIRAGLPAPGAKIADGSGVCWVERDPASGESIRCSPTASPIVGVLGSAGEIREMATDGKNVYWAAPSEEGKGLYRILRSPRSQGADTVLLAGKGVPSGFFFYDGNVYFFVSDYEGPDKGAVFMADAATGAVAILMNNISADSVSIVAAGNHVFWATSGIVDGSQDGRIFMITR